jgi:hypothetical protein
VSEGKHPKKGAKVYVFLLQVSWLRDPALNDVGENAALAGSLSASDLDNKPYLGDWIDDP